METVIQQSVEAQLVAAAPRMATIPARLRYDRTEPFAVTMTFPARSTLEGVEVTWSFARDLLTAGLTGEAGMGDGGRGARRGALVPAGGPPGVRGGGAGGGGRPGEDQVVMEFHAPEGTAVVRVRAEELRRFAARTIALVPPGREYLHLDLDRDLALLIRDTR
ncbi:SsgA family sporulation/cell division regulator [Streptomyces sp. PGLac3x]